jgi:hypothetical protein
MSESFCVVLQLGLRMFDAKHGGAWAWMQRSRLETNGAFQAGEMLSRSR